MASSRMNCQQFQTKMAKRRERDFQHQQNWERQVDYYKKFEKTNSKFDDWTSPRYYESNTELVDRLKEKRNKEESLEKRRERLKKLFSEDSATYEIEMMMSKAKQMEKERVKLDDIPTELLKDLNVGLKVEEEERRKKDAELKLYQRWRRDNLVLRDVERNKGIKDVKVSWLDQQIEKRMAKEKEKEECKKYLKERDENIQKQKDEEERFKEEVRIKNEQLKDDLMKQIVEINLKQKESEELKRIEKKEIEKKQEVFELEQKLKELELYTRNKQIAIHNLKQHKLKLQKYYAQIQEDLIQEQNFVDDLIKSKATDLIQDAKTKREIKSTLDEFLKFTKEQKELEKKRKNHLDFIFDSELKDVLKKQQEIWDGENLARKNLLKQVLDTIQKQIDENVKKNREKQKEIVRDRERILGDVERYEKEMRDNEIKENEKRCRLKDEIEREVQQKRLKEFKLKELEKRDYDVELENMRLEEERVKKEIVKIQNSHAPLRYVKRRPWY
ncbi:trichoplein keratin filament-binding protein-like [Onthophagus taurus]|uniref:trichoplein keratin filament-binding protein-like n=1 Tax=Onthophagus taurus TaxID=166361 RepID=UPI0039BE03C6